MGSFHGKPMSAVLGALVWMHMQGAFGYSRPLQLMCDFNPVHFNPVHFNPAPTERANK
jgi:hypothetical protein